MQRRRPPRIAAIFLIPALLALTGCDMLSPSTDIAQVFRQAYVPGLIEGLTTAVSSPENVDAGLRRTVTAFLEGIGAVLTPEGSR